MKIVILTTQTSHHTWYVKKMMEIYPSVFCVIETTGILPQFHVEHEFEKQREIYEKNYFFSNEITKINAICETLEVKNINDQQTVSFLNEVRPDFVISFGPRKIEKHIIELYPNKILNLHGGDPEKYRGLDSHLWAIYHNDWDALITTLHILNEELDDGEIIQKCSLDLKEITEIYQLRALNTEVCVKLSLSALKIYEMFGHFVLSKQQKTHSKYYSFMPTELKEICMMKFKKYINLEK